MREKCGLSGDALAQIHVAAVSAEISGYRHAPRGESAAKVKLSAKVRPSVTVTSVTCPSRQPMTSPPARAASVVRIAVSMG
ncbi:MAG TPA: hypothetical protein VME17_04110 [Bryobacteraceae bacterium]|nr:hypothetical protein [Bryobacteraceae bacterium]